MGRYDARIKQAVELVEDAVSQSLTIAGTSVPCILSDQAFTETGEDAGSRVVRRLETDIRLENLSGIDVSVGQTCTYEGVTYRIQEPKTTHSNGNVIRITWGAE